MQGTSAGGQEEGKGWGRGGGEGVGGEVVGKGEGERRRGGGHTPSKEQV